MTIGRISPAELRHRLEHGGSDRTPRLDGERAGARRPSRLLVAGVVAALAAGVALRSFALSPLWLDEAQSVAIARLPLDQLFAALRQDGSPPLYYLLLHAWMLAFGASDLAVRSLSGVFSVAALPLAWSLGRRVTGSPAVGWSVLVLLASSPFAIRYATETRMYALVILLTVLGGHALLALRRPGPGPVLAVAAVTGLLTFTHYWTFFLLAVVGGGLLWLAVRRGGPERQRRAARMGLLGMALGGLAFVPWLPSFLYQLAHTGAPWAPPPKFTSVAGAVDNWAGGTLAGQLLAFAYWALLVLAIVGRVEGSRLVLRLPGRRVPGVLALLAFGPLLIGIGLSLLLSSAYSSRHAAIGLAAFLLLSACGVAVLPRTARHWTLAGLAVLGLSAGIPPSTYDRTQAAEVEEVIQAKARPGDVVVVCPDQLGPALRRLLPGNRLRQVAYPTFADPARVDWTDYEQRNEAADPAAFAERVDRLAGGHAVWLVYADGYETIKYQCSQLRSELQTRRPSTRTYVHDDNTVLEHETLIRLVPGRGAR